MALPKQVQAELEAAERLQQTLAAPPEALVEDENPPANEAVEPPAPPEPPQAIAPSEPPQDQDAAYWRQRFDVMQGKYNSEVPRLNEQLRQMAEQMQALTSRLDKLPPTPAPQPAPERPMVTPQDEDKFGADLIEVMRRAARDELRTILTRVEAIESAVKSVAPQVERVKRVEQEVAQSRADKFWTDLAAAVPDWEQVNSSQPWLDWLKEVDPLIGVPRQVVLEHAQRQLDAQRAIAVFKAFKALAPSQTTQARTSELTRQVAPSKSSRTTVAPPAQKVYTGAEYAYWLDPRRANDTPQEKLQGMIAEVERAFQEDRIRW